MFFSFSSLFNFACRAIQKTMWNYVHAMATFLCREKTQKIIKSPQLRLAWCFCNFGVFYFCLQGYTKSHVDTKLEKERYECLRVFISGFHLSALLGLSILCIACVLAWKLHESHVEVCACNGNIFKQICDATHLWRTTTWHIWAQRHCPFSCPCLGRASNLLHVQDTRRYVFSSIVSTQHRHNASPDFHCKTCLARAMPSIKEPIWTNYGRRFRRDR